MTDLDVLLADVADEEWKNRVKGSVNSVLELYDLDPDNTLVYRQEILPENLFIAALEECVLEEAEELFSRRYGTDVPVTVIHHQNKNVLFMGSNRSFQFLLQGKNPVCIVVRLPDHVSPKIVAEARKTLREVFETQKQPRP